MARRPLRERVLSRLIIDPSGCLLWTGGTSNGYGRIHAGGRVLGRFYLVHRLMYEWFVGPIPAGMTIDHLCRVRHCASPAHLEAVTNVENVMRGMGFGPVNAAKTHCARGGHLYDELNTYVDRHGKRSCRTCRRESNRRFDATRPYRSRRRTQQRVSAS